MVLFDLDNTLVRAGHHQLIFSDKSVKEKRAVLFPEVLDILHYLKSRKYIIGVVSHNSRAREVLTALELDDVFDAILGYKDVDKVDHITQMRIFYPKVIHITLFDDSEINIQGAESIGVRGILIQFGLGVNMLDIARAGL